MRALLPASAAVVLASMSLAACDQDYASSNANRETFMGEVHAQPPASSSPPAAPPMAPPTPPNVAPAPVLAPVALPDAGAADAASKDAAVAAPPRAPAAHP
jgi:hypothetical protein